MENIFNTGLQEYLPLRDVVFKTLRDAIISGRISPGERLLEKEISESIGVSRTPVREALRMLAIEGLVEMVPRKGAMVKVISEKEVRDVLEVRAALEALAARLSCVKMNEAQVRMLVDKKLEFEEAAKAMDITNMAQSDSEFHELLFSSSGNEKLMQILNNLREQIYRYRVAYLKDQHYLQNIVKEHDEIVDAIRSKDQDASEKAAASHIAKQQHAIMELLKKS